MINTSSVEELKTIVPSVKMNEPLAPYSSFGIGGPADFYVEISTSQDLQNLWNWAQQKKTPLFPIGQGSNILISDKGIRGIVVRLKGEFDKIVFDGINIEVGAGVRLPVLAKKCAEQGLSGTESLVGIPGTLGGGLMTNAGTKEGDIGQLVEEVEVLDSSGQIKILKKSQIHFSYRHSDLQGQLVLKARLKLRRGEKNDIMKKVEFQLKRRGETQPIGTNNCGSVFKNPQDCFAAQLVESVGLKGFRVGDAQVSKRHANFIENVGRATAQDVKEIIDTVRRAVKEKHGIQLELEVWLVGD